MTVASATEENDAVTPRKPNSRAARGSRLSVQLETWALAVAAALFVGTPVVLMYGDHRLISAVQSLQNGSQVMTLSGTYPNLDGRSATITVTQGPTETEADCIARFNRVVSLWQNSHSDPE